MVSCSTPPITSAYVIGRAKVIDTGLGELGSVRVDCGGRERKQPVSVSVLSSAAPRLAEIHLCELYSIKGINYKLLHI